MVRICKVVMFSLFLMMFAVSSNVCASDIEDVNKENMIIGGWHTLPENGSQYSIKVTANFNNDHTYTWKLDLDTWAHSNQHFEITVYGTFSIHDNILSFTPTANSIPLGQKPDEIEGPEIGSTPDATIVSISTNKLVLNMNTGNPAITLYRNQ